MEQLAPDQASTDDDLLARWVSASDAEAFAALARKHAPIVHAIAMRQTGRDAHLADDITQAVFIVLARRAGSIRSGAVLGAWLHQTTRYAASSARRLVERRRYYESRAAVADEASTAIDTIDPRLALLDDAIASLNHDDRRLIIARYFQGDSVDHIASEDGASARATQKRIERAVTKLRHYFATHRLPVTAAGVTTVLTAAAAQQTASAAVPDPTTSSAEANAIGNGVLSMMRWSKIRIVALVVAALSLAGVLGIETTRRIVAQTPATRVPSDAKPGAAPTVPAAPPAAPTTQPQEIRYAAHPSLDVLKVGSFTQLKDGEPVGWTDIDPIIDGVARVVSGNGQILQIRGDNSVETYTIATRLDLKPEWKWMTVAARVRTHDIHLPEGADAVVRFVLIDAQANPTRTIAELRPATTGTYRDWMKPTKTFQVNPGESALRIEIVLQKAGGTFEIDDIIVVPNDPEKELDLASIRSFYTVIDANDVATAKAMIEKDKRYLECRSPGGDGNTPLIRTAWTNKPEIAKLLLDMGADIHAVDYNWRAAPIGWAGYLGRLELTKLLIDRGADVNATNGTGTTALGSAEFGLNARQAGDATPEERRAVIALLRDHGASTQAKKPQKKK